LPYVGWDKEEKKAVVQGVALFVDDKMTGDLNTEETSLLLVLMEENKKELTLNLKVGDEHKDFLKNYVDIAVRKINRDLKIEEKDGKIQVKVDVELKVEIDEFAEDHLYNTEKVKKISEEIKKRLNQIGVTTIKKIQEANSDVLGIEIGRAHV